MTDEEIIQHIEDGVNRAVEKALLALPEVWANLTIQKASMKSLTEKVYSQHPHWQDHKNIVQPTIMEFDAANPGLAYEKIIEKATPEIERRIGTVKGLDTKKGERPKDLSFHVSDHGVL